MEDAGIVTEFPAFPVGPTYQSVSNLTLHDYFTSPLWTVTVTVTRGPPLTC
jgi:hypothetical protein